MKRHRTTNKAGINTHTHALALAHTLSMQWHEPGNTTRTEWTRTDHGGRVSEDEGDPR